ncbi:MAG: hypothetical protein K2M94_00335 [Paramuribaculum sp.]|nr:hypothetical protein [Paramuribaculum sp.]
MKKIYSLILSLALTASMASAAENTISNSNTTVKSVDEQIINFWMSSMDGATTIYSDAALTNKVLEDHGSADGVEEDLSTALFPDGLYLVITPDPGMAFESLVINDTWYFPEDMTDGYIHINLEDIPDLEWGIAMSVFFELDLGGINDITATDNGKTEYFNLQGVRVDADNLTNGIYVTRLGNKAAKILIQK